MVELQKNQSIRLSGGATAIIDKELGRGGQGIVYLVNVAGEKKALKWYINPPDEDFYRNLETNINKGAPSDAFIWPEYLVLRQNGSYGYVMKLRPQNYYEFGNFLIAKVRFKSFDAMLAAAMKICEGFRLLHLSGFSYQDLNDGNFFIDPTTGDVLICDNDNVVANGEKSGIMGKARYMAPEVVAGGVPDSSSDRFSLAVILFMLFFLNHPFEGARVVACPCLTEEFEKKFYGSEALFIYDKNDPSNPPVRGIHNNVIKRWKVFPEILKNTFIDEFSQEKLKGTQKRLLEQEWEKIISRVRDNLVICPNCSDETFTDDDKPSCSCMNCGKTIDISKRIFFNKRSLPLTDKTKIFIDNDNTPDGLVTADNNGILLLKNVSPETWTVTTASGKVRTVAPTEAFPIKENMKIKFSVHNISYEAEIKFLQLVKNN